MLQIGQGIEGTRRAHFILMDEGIEGMCRAHFDVDGLWTLSLRILSYLRSACVFAHMQVHAFVSYHAIHTKSWYER